ncbi:MAG: LIC_13387 family protein [Aureispira sp.]
MKTANRSYKIASWTLMLGGIIHTVSDLMAPETAERKEIMLQMKAFTGQVLGAEFNLLSFFQGFSFMMGLLLFGYGALNLLILKNNQEADLPYNILIFNVVITLAAVLLSIQYFFIVPVLLTGIPFLGFVTALLTRKRAA